MNTDLSTLTDGQLLADFANSNSQEAFAELVNRHGTMVHGVCLRLLGDYHEAQDVAQATFLTLTAKAASLRREPSVGGWLHVVARRLACNVLKNRARRQRHEDAAMKEQEHAKPTESAPAGFREELDAAIGSMPDRYRQAVILFHMEGHSMETTAQRLGLKMSALGMRLSRAREVLRKKLVRRGVTVGSVAALTTLLSAEAGAAVLPASFVSATVKAAPGKLAAGVATGVVSAKVAALTKVASQMLFWSSVRTSAAVVITVAAAAVGASSAANTLSDGPTRPTWVPWTLADKSLPRQPGTVPLALLVNMELDGLGEKSPMLLEDGRFRLGQQLRVLAGLDAGGAIEVESELTAIFEEYLKTLEQHHPTVETSATRVVLTFAELGKSAAALESRVQTLFSQAVKDRRLTATQAAFLRARSRTYLDDAIPLLNSSIRLGFGRRPVLDRMVVTLEGHSTADAWDCQALRSTADGETTWGNSLHAGAAGVFLRMADIPVILPPFPRVSASAPDLRGIRGHDPDTVPLGVLVSLAEHDTGLACAFAHASRGRVVLASAARDICGLTASEVAAVENAYSEIYATFLSVLTEHPPRVATNGPGSATLVFDDLRDALRPLRERSNHALDDLVARHVLRADQAALLRLGSRMSLDRMCFGYGERLQTIAMRHTPGKAGFPWFRNNRPVWSLQLRYGRDSRRGSEGSDTEILPEIYRPFLWFTPFGRNEALPRRPSPAAGGQTHHPQD